MRVGPEILDPLEYLHSLQQFGIKLGLDNIRTLCAALGHPERAFHSIHIAGTNGKGSVTAMVDAILRASGYRCGRYTSPHLIDLAERFVVDGKPVEGRAVAGAVADIRDLVLDLRAKGRLPVEPTFFEVTTAVALELFRRAGVTLGVCEVGLGGRLDATNVISPLATAITSIALDHEQHLGTTLAEISFEKAGILKADVPVVVGSLDHQASAVVRRVAAERGAPVIWAHDGVRIERLVASPDGSRLGALRTPSQEYIDLSIALPGRHQIANAIVAVRVVEALSTRGVSVEPAAVRQGLAQVEWPGRLQQLRLDDGRELLLDAAHNPAGALTLAAFLTDSGLAGRPLIFAAMRDKAVARMLAALAPLSSAVVVTRTSASRSTELDTLARLARDAANGIPVVCAASPSEALDLAWSISPSVVAAGSIFLIGDLLRLVRRP
jgi:dihydrofolate synthase/folylpolyglutamate synthase